MCYMWLCHCHSTHPYTSRSVYGSNPHRIRGHPANPLIPSRILPASCTQLMMSCT
nr:MAG TPA: hypothetical protein [Caudoviricetes sp.]